MRQTCTVGGELLLLLHRHPQRCRWKLPEYSTVEQVDPFVKQYRGIVAGIRQAFAKIRHFLQARGDIILRASCIHFACIHCPGAFDFNNAVLLKRYPKQKNQSVSLETLIAEQLPATPRDVDHLCKWMNYCKQNKSFTQ